MKREPLLTASFLVALVTALLNVLAAFGVAFTEEQMKSLNQLMVVAAPVIVGIVGRYYVTPVPPEERGW